MDERIGFGLYQSCGNRGVLDVCLCLFDVVGHGLGSTSPAFVRSRAIHPAGLHGRLAQKNGKSGPYCCGREGSIQCAQQFVTAPPLVRCVVWSLQNIVITSIHHKLQITQITTLRIATRYPASIPHTYMTKFTYYP